MCTLHDDAGTLWIFAKSKLQLLKGSYNRYRSCSTINLFVPIKTTNQKPRR